MDVEFTVPLQELFSYKIIWLITGLVLIAIATLVFSFFLARWRKLQRDADSGKRVKKPGPVAVPVARIKYTRQLNRLEKGLQNGALDERTAYQELSRIIRMFTHEVTRIDVQNYSFSEISAQNIPQLTELVREYYEPEFSQHAEGDILASLHRTGQVISLWR